MRRIGQGDVGDIVVGWLTRMLALLAVLAVVGFDTVSIAVARVGASDDANTAAATASQTWAQTHDINQAYQAAVASLNGDRSETILQQGFSVDATGLVHLKLRRVATTLVAHDIGPLRHLAVIVVSGAGVAASQ